jgi:hypothetical protein
MPAPSFLRKLLMAIITVRDSAAMQATGVARRATPVAAISRTVI